MMAEWRVCLRVCPGTVHGYATLRGPEIQGSTDFCLFKCVCCVCFTFIRPSYGIFFLRGRLTLVIPRSTDDNFGFRIAFEKISSVQAVVGSIVLAFPRLKKPRCREMSARGYALHSVSQLSFFLDFGLFTPSGVGVF